MAWYPVKFKTEAKIPALTGIAITTQPTKTEYNVGENFDPAGMVVTASYDNGASRVVSSYTYSPKTFETAGTKTVTISYNESEIVETAALTVNVKKEVKIVAWATGTDAEIAEMVAAADAGLINLADYWTIGQERKVNLSEMAATGVGESHAKQTVTMVLMHEGGYKLANGKTCSFVVGQKNGLTETGYMNSDNDNSGSWNGCARRNWCNSVYYNSFPAALKSIFKKFKTITAEVYNGTSLQTSEDMFALPAEREIFGEGYGYAGNGYSNNTEAACKDLVQFEYYKTTTNRIKKAGDAGSADYWWERSPDASHETSFCIVSSDGSVNSYGAPTAKLLAPFGCI